MASPSRKRGRPVLVKDAVSVSVRFSRKQLNRIERIGGPSAGSRPKTIRRLCDLGMAALKESRS